MRFRENLVREKIQKKVLTKCWRCGIMEKLAATSLRGQPKAKAPLGAFKMRKIKKEFGERF